MTGPSEPIDPISSGEPDEEGGMSAILARAQAAVEGLAKDYTTWARADVERARKALEAARSDPAQRARHVEDLFRVAHDLKGQGASFGYPLVTRIADSLCRLTRDRKLSYEERHLDLAKSHLDAAQLVLTKEIKGEGGQVGAELCAKLQTRVDEILG
ncbi:MAG TPA: Hpt domain-containing protein [Dongiaceae bacterium]|nr:Hpt domain-containing protein [Dongiaceae bacterium]